MFYDDELEACADKLKRESLCNWSRLPCKGFPIIFEGIKGRDMREEKSPSFFNPEEAAVVVQYVKDLKDARGINVLPSQIGVISPYRKQVQNTVAWLQKKKYSPTPWKVIGNSEREWGWGCEGLGYLPLLDNKFA